MSSELFLSRRLIAVLIAMAASLPAAAEPRSAPIAPGVGAGGSPTVIYSCAPERLVLRLGELDGRDEHEHTVPPGMAQAFGLCANGCRARIETPGHPVFTAWLLPGRAYLIRGEAAGGRWVIEEAHGPRPSC